MVQHKQPAQPPGKWDLPVSRSGSTWQQISPPQLFVGSFVLLILLGTLGLRLLPGLYAGEPLSWLDALFTATSAVCVTGLIVVDTATYFTFWGQAFLLLLIQLGGLGMLTLTSMIIISLGRRLSLRQEALYTGSLQAARTVTQRRLIFDIVRFTLILEAIGALALFLLWLPRFGWKEAVWHAVFQSISAFCNAGFSTFSDSLVGFQESSASLAVVILLIVIGGLGFLTLEEVVLRLQAGRRRQIFRLSLHSRLVLACTVLLLLGGWILFALFEWHGTLSGLTPGDRLTNALFASVTCRTAGFHTIDYAQATDSTNFLSILLMMIGGSPGSTAGGMKTTTFALIGLLAWSRFGGFLAPVAWGRSVRDETTQRAVGLFVVAVGLVTLGIFVLTVSERAHLTDGSFLVKMFEVVSAFNTVGLSMGMTSELSAIGKVTTILLMFLGRVGPLTLAAALFLRRHPRAEFRYAYEDVVIG
jgi:trk system potassium uptake protein